MKNILFEISQQEKNRILEMHKKATSNNYLTEGAGKKECLDGDCQNGTGKFKETDSNGDYDLFEGTFKNGKLNGQGKHTSTIDGLVNRIREGSFKDGKLNGQGKLTATKRSGDEKVFKQGNFKDGDLYQGKTTYSKGGSVETEQEGNFKDNSLIGQGKLTNRYGCVFKGNFKGEYPNKTMTFEGKDYDVKNELSEFKCKRGDVNNFDDKMQKPSRSDIGKELQNASRNQLPSSLQGKNEPYKLRLKTPENGVQDLFYDVYTGKVTTSKGDQYSKLPTDLSKDEVIDWFKKNKIKLTESELTHLVKRIIKESENKQAEIDIENCDEDDDMVMERCVDNLFADMTEKEAENYIKELSMQKPPWLIKLIRWFRRTGKKIRRQVKRTKPADRALNVGGLVTFATLTALFMTHTREIFDRMGNNPRMD